MNLKELSVEPTEAQMHEMAEKCCFFGQRTVGAIKKLTAENVEVIYRSSVFTDNQTVIEVTGDSSASVQI
ncbi:MAG: hypothetical protein LUH00_06315 [Lachnospiraceae bacterium]|nr:hypothetical protein [Lachnospiraceae bacterium]